MMRFEIRLWLVAFSALLLTACEGTPAGPAPLDVSSEEGKPNSPPPANPVAQRSPVPFVWSPDRGIEEVPLPSDALRGEAVAINSSGEVAGWYQPDRQPSRAFVWSRTKGMYVLPTPPAGMDGAVGAVDINDRGEVLGMMSFAWAPTISFVWSVGAGFRILGPADRDVLANAINNNGEVVGLSIRQYGNGSAPNVAHEAFIWDPTRGFQNITRSGKYEIATATHINDAGEIVGFEGNGQTDVMSVRGGGRLLRWASRGSEPVELTPPVSIEGCDNWWSGESMNVGCGNVTAVNLHGEAVGSLNGRAFRSVPGKSPVFLSQTEGRGSFATSINDAGVVTGYTVSNPGFGAVIKAFVWHPDGSVTRLPNLPGRTVTYATAINNNGQIVGIAR